MGHEDGGAAGQVAVDEETVNGDVDGCEALAEAMNKKQRRLNGRSGTACPR